jgi:predicted glutamine amidotransferase
MCRLLGIVSSEPTEFRIVLREAPRSIAQLSKDHRDGWGLAVYGAADRSGWSLHKGVKCAGEDQRFHELAVGSRGELLVAHIRQKTVGETSLDNTHPFHSGRWVFAHNGTIKDTAWLRERASAVRVAQIRGQTDSELFFAYLLTRLDEAGVTDAPASAATDKAVASAAAEARARPHFGAFNFLLSDGDALYAHRFGRTLWLLERNPDDVVRPSRRAKDGTIVETPWSQRRHAILLASEHLTNEPWEAIEEGMLLRLDRLPIPRWRLLAA